MPGYLPYNYGLHTPHSLETILRSLGFFWLFLPQAIMIRIQPNG
jgi:hypothetical protein